MVRAVREEDFESIMALYKQLHPQDPVPSDSVARRSFDLICATDGMHLLVLERAGRVVATAYLNVIPNLTRSASPYAVIENIVVDADFRGQGLGRKLMAGVLDEAWRLGCYKAMLMTGSRKTSTLGFYGACGFSADDKAGFVARPPTA